ncbi:MAG: NAD-dependent succinate-semialdehyde dehydrogenase [Flavipsychrobacter sp.]
MEKFRSINPYNNQVIEEFETYSESDINNAIELADNTYKQWRLTSFEERSKLFKKAANILRERKDKYARSIVLEMGKPITQAHLEIEKCAMVCEYYANNAANMLKDEVVPTDAEMSMVKYHPLGTILAIMPWNYPYWQVFRFAAPALMAGNVCLLKHAQNVIRCSLNIDEIFKDAGFPHGAFQSLIITSEQTVGVIEHKAVKAVTLTGSERAGKSVAATAGRNIKKTVLELGGSNAFVVLSDADLADAAKVGTTARMVNTGQSCIAAKRFIVMRDVAEAFTQLLKENIQALQLGNPLDETTGIGPMARLDLAEALDKQVQTSIEKGAKLLMGGKRTAATYLPTILTDVTPGMPAFDEELFGPVASIIVVDSVEEALKLANKSNYGLGVSVCTKNATHAQLFIDHSEDGAVFINSLVKSDPRLPFGGTKISGYGRELSEHGIKEFVNIKTVFVKGLSL